MQPTSAKEYRKGRTRHVKLESGKVFEIQKPSPLTLIRVMKIFGLEIPIGAKPGDIEKSIAKKINETKLNMDQMVELFELLLPDCSKTPKLVIGPAPNENCLSIDELVREDAFELFEQMMEFSGIGGTSAKVRNSFPS